MNWLRRYVRISKKKLTMHLDGIKTKIFDMMSYDLLCVLFRLEVD